MQNDLEETAIAAFMCNQPVIIVEGQDDIKFYDNIATLNNINVDVCAIETVAGYTEGCEQVCDAMTEVQNLFVNNIRLKRYVVGIIDRDSRQYLNTLPVKDNLLVLKYYSYETHLITDKTIKKLIEQLTMVPGSMITQDVVDYLKQEFDSKADVLYYFSLEALKKMCEPSYQSDITYGVDGGAVIGGSKNYKWGLIEPKVDDLDQFALSHNISKNELKYIAKGKWFLSYWCEFLYKESKELKLLCGIKIPKCKYCEAGQNEKCLWRPSSSFQVPIIESLLYTTQFIDKDEVKYISDFMIECLAC